MERPHHPLIKAIRQSFFDEGILNDAYLQLEKLEDGSCFVENFCTTYFKQADKDIIAIEEELNNTPCDIMSLSRSLHSLKEGSACVGAAKVLEQVNRALVCQMEGDMEGLKNVLEKLKVEQNTFHNKLTSYFEQQRSTIKLLLKDLTIHNPLEKKG